MTLTPVVLKHIDQHLDEGAPLPPDIEILLQSSEETRRYWEERKRLLKALAALPPVDAPADLTNSVMAFIEQRELESRTFRHPASWKQPSFWSNTLRTLSGLFPDLSIPQVVRREAWALGLSALAILWGTLIGPQVQSGQAQAYLVPMAHEVIAFADSLQAKSMQLSDRLAMLANELITPDASTQSDTRSESQSGADIQNSTSGSDASLRLKPQTQQVAIADSRENIDIALQAHC